MLGQARSLSEAAVAHEAPVRSLAGVRAPMLGQILPRREPLAAELAYLRFLAGVHPDVGLHVLPSYAFPAYLTLDSALAGVSASVLLVAVAVERLEVAELALELLPRHRVEVSPHVAAKVGPVGERSLADLARYRLLLGVGRHVNVQSRSIVETFIADLAEHRVVGSMAPDVLLQAPVRRQDGAAYVAHARRAVESHVDSYVPLLLEFFVTNVALDRPGREELFSGPIGLDFLDDFLGIRFHSLPVLPAALSPVSQQRRVLGESLAAMRAGKIRQPLLADVPTDTTNLLLGSVQQQGVLGVVLLVAGAATVRSTVPRADTRLGVYYTIDHLRDSVLEDVSDARSNRTRGLTRLPGSPQISVMKPEIEKKKN